MSKQTLRLLVEAERRGWEVLGPYDGQYVLTHPEISEDQHPMHVDEWLVDWVELQWRHVGLLRGMLYSWLGQLPGEDLEDLREETESLLEQTKF